MKTKNTFSADDMQAFKPESKIGLLATVNPEGKPHVTLITTLQAKTEKQIFWGQFVQGQSKENLKQNPKAGFFIMTPDKNFWTGKAHWTHSVKEGSDFEYFNNLPMWRYNAYFGIHTIHYMDLLETTERRGLPVTKIVVSSVLTKFSKNGVSMKNPNKINPMNPWTRGMFNKLDALKFIAYIGKDGYPRIIPTLQCQTADSDTLVFHRGVFSDHYERLQPGSDVAVFGLTLSMEDVLVRGKFSGFQRHRGVSLGRIHVDWVYNSMPPIPGQVYPPNSVREVQNF